MAVKYLVTGAAGHVGSAVVRELLDGGRAVRALVLPGDRAAAGLPAGLEIVEGDVLDERALERFFDVPIGTGLVVIHCAGVVSTSMKGSPRLREVNVNGTKQVAALCARRGVEKFIYVSSVHAMPTLPQGRTMTEMTDFDPSSVVGPYAKSKAEATAAVYAAIREEGLNAIMVFPCGVLGPYDYACSNHITQLLLEFAEGRMPFGVRCQFDFVDVRDVAQGILAAADRGHVGEGYILGNRQTSIRELFELFHKETGGRPTRLYVPLWLAKAGLPFLTLANKLRRRPPLFCAYSLHTLGENSLYSHAKVERELGYHPRPMADTIRDTVAWLRDAGKL